MKAVIVAAGQGTRMRPLTETRPKPMLMAAGRPLLSHVLDAAVPYVDEFIIVVGYENEVISEHFEDSFRETSISFVRQGEQNGTADAIHQAESYISDEFIALNADIVIESEAIAALANLPGPGVIGREVPNPSNYGVFDVSDGIVTNIVEKPADPPSKVANLGVYRLPPTIFEYIEQTPRSPRGEYEITDSLQRFIDDGGRLAIEHYDGEWLDVGRPWELLSANRHLLNTYRSGVLGRVEPATTLNGQVRIEEGARIRNGTYIEGDVLVQSGADIGPNAYVRGSTTIGPDVRVGNAVEVKNSILMAGASVGHQSYVGDSILGENVNLGAGTNVANLRHDEENVAMKIRDEVVDTGRRKFGVVLGDGVKTGINTSLNAGIAMAPGETTMLDETVLKNRP